MALVSDPDFNIMQQSRGLFAIAKLLVLSTLKQTKTLTVSGERDYRCLLMEYPAEL